MDPQNKDQDAEHQDYDNTNYDYNYNEDYYDQTAAAQDGYNDHDYEYDNNTGGNEYRENSNFDYNREEIPEVDHGTVISNDSG